MAQQPSRTPAPAADPVGPTDGPLYPGGESLPAYRWAFNTFVFLFLLLVCIGLLMYLGWYIKAWTA